MCKSISRFIRNENGASMVEYSLMVALIALVAAVGATTLGNGLDKIFGDIGDKLAAVVVP